MQAALEPLLTASSHVGRSDMLVIIARCPELMEQQPEQLEQRVQALLDLTRATPQQLVHLLLKASYLLQHDSESIKSKVCRGVPCPHHRSCSCALPPQASSSHACVCIVHSCAAADTLAGGHQK